MKPKILALSGSSRHGSFNTRLASLAVRDLNQMGAEATLVDLGDFDLPLVDAAGYGEKAPVKAHELRALIDAHHGLFITSPEYNAGYSPLIKNALDWTSIAKPGAPGTGLSGKIVALGSVSPGPMGGYRCLTQLRTVLELGFGATLVPEMVAVGNSAAAFGEHGGLSDERAAGFMKVALTKLIAYSTKLNT